MRIFMVFCYSLTVAATDLSGYNYESVYQYLPFNPLEKQVYTKSTARDTEFITYTAPESFHDSRDINRLAALIRPQRVVFIKNPERNIFSITAEQLAKQQPLSIFVLNRQTDSAALLSQLKEIRERVEQKPNVQFVKYRTTEDIERAKQAIFNDFDAIPGSTKYQEDQQTSVFDFDSKSQHFYSAKEDRNTHTAPVIFEIKRRSTPAPISQMDWQHTSHPSKENQEYLPPNLN